MNISADFANAQNRKKNICSQGGNFRIRQPNGQVQTVKLGG